MAFLWIKLEAVVLLVKIERYAHVVVIFGTLLVFLCIKFFYLAYRQTVLVEIRTCKIVCIFRVVRTNQINIVPVILRCDYPEMGCAFSHYLRSTQINPQRRGLRLLNLRKTYTQVRSEVFCRIVHVIETGMKLRSLIVGRQYQRYIVPTDLRPLVIA